MVNKKVTYRVFADYESSGIWENGAGGRSVDIEYVHLHVRGEFLLLLAYWQSACIMWMNGCDMKTFTPETELKIKEQLDRDGQFIVDRMNETQDMFEFIYLKLD